MVDTSKKYDEVHIDPGRTVDTPHGRTKTHSLPSTLPPTMEGPLETLTKFYTPYPQPNVRSQGVQEH